jgi:hypothetical protein
LIRRYYAPKPNTVHLSILIRFSKSTRSLQGTVLGRR